MKKFRKLLAAYVQHKISEKKKREADPKFKKREFAKKLAIFCCVLMVISLLLSVFLSLLDKDPLIEITATVISVCGGYLVSYGIKSAFEKNSRNKYGLDEFGTPWNYTPEVDYSDEETEENIYG